MTSVIIPAHDEEGVIGSTLTTLLHGSEDDGAGDLDIVVVCNGCTDGTAGIAASFGPTVTVLEIEEASKVAALNAGDEVAGGYPRIYLDADIAFDGRSAFGVAEALRRPGALAAEPHVVIDTRRSSLVVRAYYAVSQALHGQVPGDLGGGVYALSEAGRMRFGRFPDVIADDGYARAHFGRGEISRVAGTRSVVTAPAGAADLVNIKTRSRLGTLELERRYPELWAGKRDTTDTLGTKIRRVPLRLWPYAPVYLVIQLLARRRARRRVEDLASYRWQRDESSRTRPA
jgi:glycosyltransferase involved in cell wall biosynthesis